MNETVYRYTVVGLLGGIFVSVADDGTRDFLMLVSIAIAIAATIVLLRDRINEILARKREP